MAEYDRLETLIQREEHVAELEARAAEREEGERSRQRPNGGDRQAPAGGGGEQRTYDQAFDEYLRRGLTAVDDADRALLREHRAHSRSEERRVGKEGVSTSKSCWSPYH